eukprot:Phypoly_transcript_23155.p1 GENE.Phypoly_transcript_23155~~Phypoly_transcript_23155.p1  ORF type:complete len:149 (+),score=27.49 Phypoly_transcript_23155:62-448(+)
MRIFIALAVLVLCFVAISMADTDSFVKQSITDHKVMVFSKSYCPYCKRAKETLNSHNAIMKVVELDQHPEGAAIQQSLAKLTGQRTVPNIFINGRHIGGADATVALHNSGELAKLLEEAGALGERNEL